MSACHNSTGSRKSTIWLTIMTALTSTSCWKKQQASVSKCKDWEDRETDRWRNKEHPADWSDGNRQRWGGGYGGCGGVREKFKKKKKKAQVGSTFLCCERNLVVRASDCGVWHSISPCDQTSGVWLITQSLCSSPDSLKAWLPDC